MWESPIGTPPFGAGIGGGNEKSISFSDGSCYTTENVQKNILII